MAETGGKYPIAPALIYSAFVLLEMMNRRQTILVLQHRIPTLPFHCFLLVFGFLAVCMRVFGAVDTHRPCSSGLPNAKWQEPGQLVNDGFRHRDLHSATFLSRDPAGFIDGPNHYDYVAHNPWSAFDPHGLATTRQIPDGTNDIGYVSDSTNVPVAAAFTPDMSGRETGCMRVGAATQ